VEYEIINKSGAWFSYEGQRIGQGRENTKIYISEHPEFMAEVDRKVREVFAKKINSDVKNDTEESSAEEI
jgi:recombination protein RecA